MNGHWRAHLKAGQRGLAAVEFALLAVVFLPLLLGAFEFGRVLFYWNTTAEATRLGARIAVVCNLNAPAIDTKMRELFPIIAAGDISIEYRPNGCTVDNCESVTVSVNPASIQTFIPFNALSMTLPTASTTLTRESLQSSFSGTPNPVCQ